MTKFEELNATNSTIIKWEGKELRTLQDPYIMNFVPKNEDVYTAPAIDSESNVCTIYWSIKNPEATDESEAADWDNPLNVYEHQWKYIN